MNPVPDGITPVPDGMTTVSDGITPVPEGVNPVPLLAVMVMLRVGVMVTLTDMVGAVVTDPLLRQDLSIESRDGKAKAVLTA